MLKVLREIFIYILLIALIVLIFGIIFYEQLPSNKIVPGKVEYSVPEKLEEELEQSLETEEEQEVLVTYTIEEDDLDRYEEADKYNPGKVDPFSDYNDGTGNTNGNSDGNNNNSSGSDGNDSTGSTNNSGGGQLTETTPGK